MGLSYLTTPFMVRIKFNEMKQKNNFLKIDRAIKNFSGMNKPAIDDISMNFESGLVHAIVGPNGAGKTTLIKIIADLITLDSGSCSFFSKYEKIEKKPVVALALEGAKGFYNRLSVLDNFKYFSGISAPRETILDHTTCLKWLDKFNLLEKSNSICQTLSRGMLQRLTLAIAVSTNADIILLDEPTNGLDIAESRAFFALVREIAAASGIIVIFCSHQPETILGLADQVYFINKGSFVSELKAEKLKVLDQISFVEYYLEINKKNFPMEVA